MKKLFFAFGMMLAATLSLTNCTKEVDQIGKEETSVINQGSFELFAKPAETKTIIDGFNVSWEGDADNVNVYHAETGTTSYVNDGEFSISAADVASGCFKGDLAVDLTTGTNYDWYVFYPYVSSKESPASTSKGWTPIGCQASSGVETQNGNNSTSHLAGSNYPLYGKVTNIADNASPSVVMEHLAAFVEFNITNNSASGLTVSSIKFDAPQNIIGTYYISFADPSNIKYTSSGNSYVANSVTLNVENGTEIASGASAKFYIGIKPMAIEASNESPKTLSITINGVYSKDITLKSNTSFLAGKVKKINVNYDYDPSAHANATFVFNTSEGLAELEINEPSSTSSGTELTGPYVKNGISLTFDANSGTTPKAWKKSGGGLELRTYAGNKLTFDAPSGFNITSIDFSSNGSYSASTGTYSGAKWTGTAAEVILTRTGTGNHASNTIVVSCEKAVVVPTIVEKVVDNIAARGASGLEASVTLSNYVAAPTISTVTPDGTIITAASVKDITASGLTVEYTISNNLSGAAREGSITLTDNDGHSGTISVNQLADVFTVSKTSIELNANSGATASFTVTSDFDWTIDDSSLNGFTVSPNSFTYTGNQKQTVTLTATSNNTTASSVDLDIFCVTRTADSKDSDDITVSQKSAKLAAPALTLTPDAANKKFTVSWTSVVNASKYEYYVLDGNYDYKVDVTQTTDASITSFVVSDINYSEEYTVVVKAIGDNNPWITSDETDDTITVTATSIPVSFSYSDFVGQGTSGSGSTITATKSNVTVSSNKGFGDSAHVRVYSGGTITVSASSGTIAKIEFTSTASGTSNNGPSKISIQTGSSGSYSYSGNKGTWSGEAQSVTFNATAQFRFTDIVVTFK